LAIAEFSTLNKPVLTSSAHTDHGHAGFHITALGKKGLFYSDQSSLEHLLTTFDRVEAKTHDWTAFHAYSAENVMKQFLHHAAN
jgi:hypothetical protein